MWNLWMSDSRHTECELGKKQTFCALAKQYLPNPTFIQVV